jgi:hypothetical protein
MDLRPPVCAGRQGADRAHRKVNPHGRRSCAGQARGCANPHPRYIAPSFRTISSPQTSPPPPVPLTGPPHITRETLLPRPSVPRGTAPPDAQFGAHPPHSGRIGRPQTEMAGPHPRHTPTAHSHPQPPELLPPSAGCQTPHRALATPYLPLRPPLTGAQIPQHCHHLLSHNPPNRVHTPHSLLQLNRRHFKQPDSSPPDDTDPTPSTAAPICSLPRLPIAPCLASTIIPGRRQLFLPIVWCLGYGRVVGPCDGGGTSRWSRWGWPGGGPRAA